MSLLLGPVQVMRPNLSETTVGVPRPGEGNFCTRARPPTFLQRHCSATAAAQRDGPIGPIPRASRVWPGSGVQWYICPVLAKASQNQSCHLRGTPASCITQVGGSGSDSDGPARSKLGVLICGHWWNCWDSYASLYGPVSTGLKQ